MDRETNCINKTQSKTCIYRQKIKTKYFAMMTVEETSWSLFRIRKVNLCLFSFNNND